MLMMTILLLEKMMIESIVQDVGIKIEYYLLCLDIVNDSYGIGEYYYCTACNKSVISDKEYY